MVVANTITNIFCGIIKEKLTKVIEAERVIGEEQGGFRKDRRGTDNLYIVKEIIEHARKSNKCYVAFLDTEKTYDTIDRKVLWEIMRRIGIEKKIIRIMESLNENTKGYILYET